MKSRWVKLTATAGATALLAGLGAVTATSASAATAPAAVTHSAAVPMGGPISAHHRHHQGLPSSDDDECVIELLGIGLICTDLV